MSGSGQNHRRLFIDRERNIPAELRDEFLAAKSVFTLRFVRARAKKDLISEPFQTRSDWEKRLHPGF